MGRWAELPIGEPEKADAIVTEHQQRIAKAKADAAKLQHAARGREAGGKTRARQKLIRLPRN